MVSHVLLQCKSSILANRFILRQQMINNVIEQFLIGPASSMRYNSHDFLNSSKNKNCAVISSKCCILQQALIVHFPILLLPTCREYIVHL